MFFGSLILQKTNISPLKPLFNLRYYIVLKDFPLSLTLDSTTANIQGHSCSQKPKPYYIFHATEERKQQKTWTFCFSLVQIKVINIPS